MSTTQDPSRWERWNQIFDSIGLALGLITLAAISSTASQMTLKPVFGETLSSSPHTNFSLGHFCFGILIYLRLGSRAHTRSRSIRSWLPVLAILNNHMEDFLIFLSDDVRANVEGVLYNFVDFHIVTIAAAWEASAILGRLDIEELPRFAWIYKSAFALISFALLKTFFASQLPLIITHSSILVPADIQLIVAAAFALLCGDTPNAVVVAWLLIIPSYLFNPHGNGPYAKTVLDSALASKHWVLLDRRWSTTGYVSVLENQVDQYRALRCDHSVLGGEWLLNDERRSQGWTRNESIYSVFTMLEAVRLVDTSIAVNDDQARALVIGLGVGTAPKSFIEYGIDTTIVELDPAVYSFAKTYFNLPTNHTIVLQDATTYLRKQASKDTFDKPQYDYIIHDVFTGGVEPLPLFTTTFIQDLRSLLKDDGIAAINYAGDLNMPLTETILNTIDRVFDQQCQMYSDDLFLEDGSPSPFNNFIVFCRNSPGEISFREPTEQDLQGSWIKRDHLRPRPEQQVPLPRIFRKTDTATLEKNELKKWRSAQRESAEKHWHIMRDLIPDRIWQMY